MSTTVTDTPSLYGQLDIMAARERLAPFTARNLSRYTETHLLYAWADALEYEGLAYEADDAKARIRDEYTTRHRVDLCAVTDALMRPPRSPREVDRGLDLLRLTPRRPARTARRRLAEYLPDFNPLLA